MSRWVGPRGLGEIPGTHRGPTLGVAAHAHFEHLQLEAQIAHRPVRNLASKARFQSRLMDPNPRESRLACALQLLPLSLPQNLEQLAAGARLCHADDPEADAWLGWLREVNTNRIRGTPRTTPRSPLCDTFQQRSRHGITTVAPNERAFHVPAHLMIRRRCSRAALALTRCLPPHPGLLSPLLSTPPRVRRILAPGTPTGVEVDTFVPAQPPSSPVLLPMVDGALFAAEGRVYAAWRLAGVRIPQLLSI